MQLTAIRVLIVSIFLNDLFFLYFYTSPFIEETANIIIPKTSKEDYFLTPLLNIITGILILLPVAFCTVITIVIPIIFLHYEEFSQENVDEKDKNYR